ncbi:MAG: YdcF family protein [Gammaproteobacteria bacterium]|nr:YdcF family protein [Gammaproteobacteria bacterium]
MLFVLKKLLRTVLLPPAGPLLLAAIGTWLVLRRDPGSAARRVGGACLVTGLASLWLLSTPVVAEGLLRLAEHYPAIDLGRPLHAQALVILGGGSERIAPEYGGPALADAVLERVSYGAYVARRTGLPVLISGAASEAVAMRAVLARDFAITPRWVIGDSRDTFTDAELSAALLRPAGISRVVLVTSSNHEWRAAHEFMSAGLEVEPAPVHVWAPYPHRLSDYLPGPLALRDSTAALYELFDDAVRRALAATHLRRHGGAAPAAPAAR